MSLDPSRPSLLQALCEICNWPLRSHSDLSIKRRRVSADNWPVHGRCRESFPSLCSSSSMVPRLVVISADVAVALVACFFDVCGYLPLDAVVRDIQCALVVTASNGLSLDRAQEHVETLSADSIVVFEKLCETDCCTPNSSLHTFSPKSSSNKCTKKRSVHVGCIGSTYQTTTQRLQQSSVVRSCL